MKRWTALTLGLVAGLTLGSCGGSQPPPPAPPAPAASAPPAAPQVSAPADPLGPRPVPKPPIAFVPPEPRVIDGPGRSKIWLLERHNLPLATVAIVVPYGSAVEPAEQGGLAFATADMLDEGAGDRDALAFSQAINDLGAKLASSADRDASIVSLEVLATKLEAGLSLMSDAVVRPRHEAKDWTRVQALWINALKNRAHEPSDVARVATSAAFYGDHPYAHPPEGTLTSAQHVQLADIASWHKRIWRPDVATFVVVGDVTPDQATSLLGKAFAAWKTSAPL